MDARGQVRGVLGWCYLTAVQSPQNTSAPHLWLFNDLRGAESEEEEGGTVSAREVGFGADDTGRGWPGVIRGVVEAWLRSSTLVLKRTMTEGANRLKDVMTFCYSLQRLLLFSH